MKTAIEDAMKRKYPTSNSQWTKTAAAGEDSRMLC